jgi:transcriptional regulator with XRE-family HTH domain
MAKAKKFGVLLREFREAKGVSLGALARHLGVSVPYLSDVERGHRPPLVQEKMISAALFLDADLHLLVRAAGEMRGAFQLETAGVRPEAREVGALLARQWPGMSYQKLTKLKQVLEEED